MKIKTEDIKKLRNETGAGVMEIKEVLEETDGDYKKAYLKLMKKVAKKAAKKSDRIIKDGLVHAYIHSGGKVGSIVLVGCETDFVAKTEDFETLCHNVAMQVCTEEFKTVEDVLNSEFIKDSSKKISDLINETVVKVGEKIELVKFTRFAVGE